ncbi:PQ-loop-domain-containing protein [Westerdykella ornata]|uniref:PQ-loop-domain-containing protein n=1 Tax=Westerdykella ornata TaxID=318751 RepID=A0A6A6JJX1_WESOR|nr:PQ-loop-domain-containing protein [Westerdykella ornata]KAF2276797.1 PQ-loop-domain-containing protein [Westerdykella ornata]
MPPYLSPLHVVQPSLPAHCEPTNAFLHHLSASFHTCVPTNLALLSTVLGTCSIVAWLFAQLPQIYKNHRLQSTSGLSLFFLVEWLLGDVSNLLGCVFTGQALWQVIIAGYYVTVDCVLVAQWIWYELLKHGRPLRSIWAKDEDTLGGGGGGPAVMQEVWDGLRGDDQGQVNDGAGKTLVVVDTKAIPPSSGRYIPRRSNPMDAFRIPNFARSPKYSRASPGATTNNTPPNRTVRRVAGSPPMPSPKTVLYLSMVLAVLSHTTAASPVSPFAPTSYPRSSLSSSSPVSLAAAASNSSSSSSTRQHTLGTFASWLSTLLYLGSRLPQLYKNHLRRSTAGLSPTLFAAAFFGNLFYASSLVTNPCAWNDFARGAGRGWVALEGSNRAEWVKRALPFFLGAAGVLAMDACMGLQFCVFGDGIKADDVGRGRSRRAAPRIAQDEEEEVVVVINDHGIRKRIHRRWRRASGWMRGWMPSVSVAGTPSVSRASTPVRSGSPASARSIVGSSGSPPGRGKALDEARSLLYGTSPRSYGGVGSG